MTEVREAITEFHKPKHLRNKPRPQVDAKKSVSSDASSKVQSAVDVREPRPNDELDLVDIPPLPYINVEVRYHGTSTIWTPPLGGCG